MYVSNFGSFTVNSCSALLFDVTVCTFRATTLSVCCSCQSGSLNLTIDLLCDDSLCITASLAHLKEELPQVFSERSARRGARRSVPYLHRLYSVCLCVFTELLSETRQFKRAPLSGSEMLHNKELR